MSRDGQERTVDARSDSGVETFRAVDALAVEVWQAARGLARTEEGAALARELRRTVARAAGALVASSGGPGADRGAGAGLADARAGLLESRYYLYLARRLGFLDVRRYRQIAARQDAALRHVEAALADRIPGNPRRPA